MSILNNIKKWSKSLGALLAVLIGAVLAYSIFNKYFISPNTYMYAFGGDALVIYYDMIYSICYDQGALLNAMNYPYGELIFLTDAQGAITMVLQWIHHHLFDISPFILGIVHGLNVYLLFPAFLLMYFCLVRLDVKVWIAGIFAPLIVLLSPQMLRFGGHYGLAYPFLIAMTLWWYTFKRDHSQWHWKDLLVALVLTFFTFNNPYTGMAAALPLFIIGGLLLGFGFSEQKALASKLILLPLIALAIPFIYFKLNDLVDDRIIQQWGFFFFNASFEGMFYPDGSLLRLWLQTWGIDTPLVEYESRQYIGVVNFIFLLTSVLAFLFRKTLIKHDSYKWMAWSAVIIFLGSSKTIWSNVNPTWLEDNLGFILMFKAMARLNWSSYFIISIGTVLVINKGYYKWRLWVIPFIILCALFWTADIRRYVGKNYKDSFHSNFMGGGHLDEMKALAKTYRLDTSHYQGILVLPKMMSWTDLILSNIHFNSQFYSMRLSAATGIPLISAMLSRMSISQTASGVQMTSHPWIKRDRLDVLDTDKPFLILCGKDHPPLQIGEEYMTTVGDTLIDNESFTLWKAQVSDIKYEDISTPILLKSKNAYSPAPILRYNYEEEMSPSFTGYGSRGFVEGRHMVIDTVIEYHGLLAFNAWTYLDYQKYGVGFFDIEIKSLEGNLIEKKHVETRRSNDIQDLWIRSNAEWQHHGKAQVSVYFESNRKLYIDELWIYPAQDTTIVKEGDFMLANGIKIKL